MRRIVEEAHERGPRAAHRRTARRLDSLADALLEHETLDEDDAYAAAGVPHAKAGETPSGITPAATAARSASE